MTLHRARSFPGASALSRRRFLLGLGATALAACSDAGTASDVDLGGDRFLTMLNWPDYIDLDDAGGGTLGIVDAELGLSVEYLDLYEDNYGGWDLITTSAGKSTADFDIVVPTNWRAAQMIEQGWAAPLPIEIIPNHVNLDPQYMTNSWDRGSRFQMPWQAGITGIAYDPALTERPLNSVEDLFDPAFAGRIGLIGEMREAVGLAMLANGDDPSRPTEGAARAGLDRIRGAVESGQVGGVVFNEFADRLADGTFVASMAWSGDAALLQADRPDIEFIIPDEGGIQWFDTMVIPANSPNLSAAGRFMNFVYDPVNAARITNFVQYISPVLGVADELRRAGGDAAALADNPILFPDDATRNRLFTWGGLATEAETVIDDEFNELVPA
ncbi:MAG: spermidine/putrescine ABC transporter substrate-binding protein [Actinomycetota bacterium]